MSEIKSIVSTLAEIDSPDSVIRLTEIANEIKNRILNENNDERYDDLNLLEKFSFRVPGESLNIIEFFADSKNKKEPQKYTEPFPRLGYSHRHILEKCVDILSQAGVRYSEFNKTFDILLRFYDYEIEDSKYAAIRKKAFETLKNMADYNLNVIRPKYSKYVVYHYQDLTLKKIEKLFKNREDRIFDLTISLVKTLLDVELEGTTWGYEKVTITRGQLFLTPTLKKIRQRLIRLIISEINSEKNILRKQRLIDSLEDSTKYPMNYTDELEFFIMQNTEYVLNFYSRFNVNREAPTIIQEIDGQLAWVIRRFCNYRGRKNQKKAASLLGSARRLRKAFCDNKFYKIYRTLVADARHDFAEEGGWKEAQEKTTKNIKDLIDQLTIRNIKIWARILERTITTYPLKQDHEFSNMRYFFRQLGESRPGIAFRLFNVLNRRKLESKSFLTDVLMGIKASRNTDLVNETIADWLNNKPFEYIKEIPFIYCLMKNKFVSKFDLDVFGYLSKKNLPANERAELDMRMVDFIPWIYKNNEKKIFELLSIIISRIPTENLSRFSLAITMSDYRGDIALNKLPLFMLNMLMQKYILKKSIDHHDERILSVFAQRDLLKLIDFFKKRVQFKPKKKLLNFDFDRYDPIPYHLGDLSKAITENKDYERAIRKILDEWIMSKDGSLSYEGRSFIQTISPSLDDRLRNIFLEYVKSSKKKAIAILNVLNTYHGISVIDDICIEAIKRYDDKQIKSNVFTALYSTGVVTGELGFYNAHNERKNRVTKWVNGNKRVRKFIKEFVGAIEKDMEQEKRNAETREELMKRDIDAF